MTLTLEIGRGFNDSVDTWFYGSAFSHRLNSNCAMAVELAGAAPPKLSRSRLLVNLAFVVDVSEHSSLLLSLGREVHNPEGPAAMLIGYGGWQLRL